MKIILREQKKMVAIFKLDSNDLQGVLNYERQKANYSINNLKHQQVSQKMQMIMLQSEWAEVILGIQTIKACI